MKPLEVRVPHHLDNAEVRRRIDRALEKARNDYAAQVGPIDAAWRDDGRLHLRFTVMGAAIESEVELAVEEVVARVTLPGFAGMFAGQVRTGIAERLGGLLGPAAP
ncbi:MAG: polyhydroxyalkanoic acid system family protein [Planctomycetaceae bacterium]